MIQSLRCPAQLLELCHPSHPQPRGAPQAASASPCPGCLQSWDPPLLENSPHTRALLFASSPPSQLFQELPPPHIPALTGTDPSAPPKTPRESPEQGLTSPPCPPLPREEEDGGGRTRASLQRNVPVFCAILGFHTSHNKLGQGNCLQFGFLGCNFQELSNLLH